MTGRLGVNAWGALILSALLAGAAPDAPVADAAMRGGIDDVRALLARGADVNAAQGDGMTALHWAAENGDRDMAELLIFAGANLRAVTRNNNHTPLHLASRAGQAALVEALLKAGSSPDARTSTGATALHLATAAASTDAVRQLVDHGADLDAKETAWEQTPLMWAAAADYLDIVDFLIVRGADASLTSKVEDIGARGAAEKIALKRRDARQDALIAFAKAEKEGTEAPQSTGAARTIEAAQARDSAQAKAAARPDSGASAAGTKPDSAKSGEPKPLTYEDLVGRKGGLSALHFAVRQGNRASALRLLDARVDIDQVTDGDHSSALLLATINGHFDLAMELLTRGANPNLASDAGAGPLYGAVNLQWHPKSNYPQPQAFKRQQTTYLELMEALLEAGANPNLRLEKTLWYMEYNFPRLSVDFAGSTPFWRAAYAQDVDAMRMLVEYGADPNIPTKTMPEARFNGNDAKKEADPSGIPPVPLGGPAAYPIHAATGVGFGQGYAGGFHRGVPGGWLATVKYLVEELGADVNARDLDGNSAMHHAASRGDVDVILYLVERGGDASVVNRKGQTTADMANSPVQRVPVYPEALQLLERLGARNNHKCQVC